MDEQQARNVLESARLAALARVQTLDAEIAGVVSAAAGSNLDDEHDPEGATIAFEREQLAAVRDQARRQLEEIGAATDRLAAGRYGVCERCGAPIPEERLIARPAVALCLRCASAHR